MNTVDKQHFFVNFLLDYTQLPLDDCDNKCQDLARQKQELTILIK